MKKNLLLPALFLILGLSLAGCGGKKEADTGWADKLNVNTGGKEKASSAENEQNSLDKLRQAANAVSSEAETPSEGIADTDIGKWILYESESGGEVIGMDILQYAGDAWLELKEGGEAEFILFGSDFDVTWKPGILKMYGAVDYPYKRDGDNLELSMGDVTYRFAREGAEEKAEMKAKAGPKAEAASASSDESADQGDSGNGRDRKDTASANVSSGDGIVSEEVLLKTYVWMHEVVTNMFDLTYEEIAEHFGVEGRFDKEEYSDVLKRNKRYYTWTSAENELDYIYINFEENDDGSWTVNAYNTNHFNGSEATAKYLDEVKAEEADESRAAAANMEMKPLTREICYFGDKTNPFTVQLEMPASGWSYNEDKDQLVDNEDPKAFGTGFIQLKLYRDMASLDMYKDDYENLKEIEDRSIGGVTFQGRTYKNIGYEWEEYYTEMTDSRAFSIGIVRLDTSEGTVADKILDSITFK